MSRPVTEQSAGACQQEPIAIREAEELLYREARLLDLGDFSAWLGLFELDCVYWIPTWRSNCETTEDAAGELSYVYFDHAALSGYVLRMTSGHAHAFVPAPRTARIVANILLSPPSANEPLACVEAVWLMHVFQKGDAELFGGRVSYALRRRATGELAIVRKKVTLNNDCFERGRFVLL